MSVVTRNADTNAVSSYFVSKLCGPRLNKVRVTKGDEVRMTEYQARALVASGELVTDKDRIDDPFGEVAAAADAKAAADKEAAEAKAAADKAAADAKAAAQKVPGNGRPVDAATPPAAI